MKLLRVIRFDQSDDRVFEQAAMSDEWAVSGVAVFNGIGRDDIKGKVRQAFVNGFLGIQSMGRSTFASVADAGSDPIDELTMRLACGFVEKFNAPSLHDAMVSARDEIEFAASLCAERPINCVFTVWRMLDDDGAIREEFREISSPGGEPLHAPIWDVVEGDG